MDNQISFDDLFGMVTEKPADLKTDEVEKPKEKEKKPAEKPAEKPVENSKKLPTDKSGKSFRAPFQLYCGNMLKDITGYFEDGREYSGEEITKIMLKHDEYFFTSKIEYDYMPETNTVVAMSVQHKKG